MISCQRATELSSEAMERKLTLRERFALFAHLRICVACVNFRRQIETLREALRALPNCLGGEEASLELKAAKERLLAKLRS